MSDEERAFAAPYVTLMSKAAPQQEYPLRMLFNAVRYLARTGMPWRYLPHEFPAWPAVYQQLRRWLDARCFGYFTRPPHVATYPGKWPLGRL